MCLEFGDETRFSGMASLTGRSGKMAFERGILAWFMGPITGTEMPTVTVTEGPLLYTP
jgi:hypothetical protein